MWEWNNNKGVFLLAQSYLIRLSLPKIYFHSNSWRGDETCDNTPLNRRNCLIPGLLEMSPGTIVHSKYLRSWNEHRQKAQFTSYWNVTMWNGKVLYNRDLMPHRLDGCESTSPGLSQLTANSVAGIKNKFRQQCFALLRRYLEWTIVTQASKLFSSFEKQSSYCQNSSHKSWESNGL